LVIAEQYKMPAARTLAAIMRVIACPIYWRCFKFVPPLTVRGRNEGSGDPDKSPFPPTAAVSRFILFFLVP
jgi:hypothetical protein